MNRADYTCACGTVRLRVHIASPAKATRAVCYCEDCQTAARHLGHDATLDGNGGTDLVQISPEDFEILAGQSNLAPLQLSPSGIFRWHATCCKSPMINTARGPGLPFLSLINHWLDKDADAIFGPPKARINLIGAYGKAVPNEFGFPKLILRFMRRALVSRMTGRYRRNPLWLWPAKTPLAAPIIITKDQRIAALRRPDHV